MNTALPFTEITSLLEKSEVEFAGLFGSYAKGEETEKSDIDILVRFQKPKSLFSIVRLEREISSLLGKDVDLVTEKALSPYMKDEVMNSVIVFYGKK